MFFKLRKENKYWTFGTQA